MRDPNVSICAFPRFPLSAPNLCSKAPILHYATTPFLCSRSIRDVFCRLLCACALLDLFSPSQVFAQEDEYLRIYNAIEEADSLSAKQPQVALAKYREAQAALK